jgi:DNA polymerase I-like protein with 3'-5' exonuclease and polymerase domains
VYGTGRNKKYIYGGRIVENLVQHLARCALADNILELRGKGLKLAHTVHDELIYVVPESQAEDTLALVQSVMRTPPFWWPELVVWSEGDVGQTYGDAK